jgi:hypothetical protein
MFQTKVEEKIKTRFYARQLFSENPTVYEIKSKNMGETEEPQMTSQYGPHEVHAG